MGRISSGPPLLLDLFNSSLAIVLATCALGASGVGYRIVEASEDSLLTGGCGVAIVNSCGLALRDLDFSRIGTGAQAGVVVQVVHSMS